MAVVVGGEALAEQGEAGSGWGPRLSGLIRSRLNSLLANQRLQPTSGLWAIRQAKAQIDIVFGWVFLASIVVRVRW